ncbi:hypothetical protein B0T25DRAFT_548877 [Lasiosphaeria hispida]|uniref:Uncharacterized protein n=1 Tax=Lasiosphaeria hispida TaxID=260671 RepID=A0AAJ0HF73_9PEZI|nr:hypothetical protein B0T25DRAFT_548877 [Lasiosphaeria hispida]
MPAKRAPAAATATAPSRAKKSKTISEAEQPAPAAPPRSKRWAAVSGSANADDEPRLVLQDPAKAFQYICMCKPPFPISDEDEEDEEEEEPEKDDGKPRCDGGKTCICTKPASEHPDHLWTLTTVAHRKFFTQYIQQELRDPDNFGMYTFNDHAAYGMVELVQNLVLDFEEATTAKEQWAICETMAYFLNTDSAGILTQIDDGDLANATYELVGRLFLTMLSRLERENLLAKDSEIENLAVIMALFMMMKDDLKQYGILDNSKQESIGPKKDKKNWSPHTFVKQVAAYAHKYDIELKGPEAIAELIDDAKDGDLPGDSANNTAAADPFGFAKALKSYRTGYSKVCQNLSPRGKAGTTPIGGDCLDLTTWTSAERKKYAFDKKDPLGKAEQDAIKQGLIIQMGR